MNGMLPSADVSPIVARYLDHYQATIGDPKGWAGDTRNLSACDVLAAEAGVDVTTIKKHLAGTRKWIGFAVADKLLFAMGKEYLWHLEPLNKHYTSMDLGAEAAR